MNIVKASYEIMDDINAKEIYKKIERVGRVCYKSEDKITDESAEKFVRGLVKRGHEAMLEHATVTVKFTVDRGVSHELVRHRVASFAQESTRYCNYSKEKFNRAITVILPGFFDDIEPLRRNAIMDYLDGNLKVTPTEFTDHEKAFGEWYVLCKHSEIAYFSMLENGSTPQEARGVLPTNLKTEIVVTTNMREWRHIFMLRAAGITGSPHPQMTEVMIPLLRDFQEKLPALFGDIQIKEESV